MSVILIAIGPAVLAAAADDEVVVGLATVLFFEVELQPATNAGTASAMATRGRILLRVMTALLNALRITAGVGG
jgi:hypothetical protein